MEADVITRTYLLLLSLLLLTYMSARVRTRRGTDSVPLHNRLVEPTADSPSVCPCGR